jgi:hypothetical protein
MPQVIEQHGVIEATKAGGGRIKEKARIAGATRAGWIVSDLCFAELATGRAGEGEGSGAEEEMQPQIPTG